MNLRGSPSIEFTDRPRSGRPRKLSHANVRAILKATVERIPRESTYWSVRLIRTLRVSKHQVAQIGRQPEAASSP